MNINELDREVMLKVQVLANRVVSKCGMQKIDIDDIAQELHIAAFTAAATYDRLQTSGNVNVTRNTYIKSAIRLAAVDQIRNVRLIKNNQHLEPLPAGLLDPMNHEDEIDTREAVTKIIAELPEHQQEICLMLMQGDTQEEIGEALKMAQPRVCEEIQRLQPVFAKLCN
jgi:RNA polymerase sigma factor (sigma-70 family)